MAEKNSSLVAIASDIVMPSQWHAGPRENPRFHGTRQLMLAVLIDALQRLQNARGRNVVERQILAETRIWIADRDREGLFAFENICEVLSIDPERLRERLGEWRREQLTENISRHRIRRAPATRSVPINIHVRRRRSRHPVIKDRAVIEIGSGSPPPAHVTIGDLLRLRADPLVQRTQTMIQGRY